MKYTYYFDNTIQMRHIDKHNISYNEINEFFTEISYLYKKRKDKSYVAIGKLKNNRYIEIIYRIVSANHLYIITAYDIESNDKIEFIESHLED
jgi:uncharacterized DUF497 family protein